ncbi:MAG: efflux RND transporter periplasmic adaptor subunit [Blastocatellia bacterium]|nr:efflux RND transporter periplasmic adaptor subunit [Blastocatellia bacterium]
MTEEIKSQVASNNGESQPKQERNLYDEPRSEQERNLYAERHPEQKAEDQAAAGETNIETPENAPKKSKKKRYVVRALLTVLLIALVAVGYAKRDFLFKVDAESADSGEQPGTGAKLKVLYWQDPMHPAYKSDKPGKAPDCGMDLVPVYEGGDHRANLPEEAFQISPEKQQLIGVKYGEAAYMPVSKTLRAVARLAYDETKIVRIHTKIEGWVEDVYVDFTGKLVEKGQPLISIYSPELLQTQQEFLLARRGRDELSESPFKEAVVGSESLYESARRRLELWDVTEEQIKELERTGKPTRSLKLYAPTDGFVLARSAYPRQRVTPETELYSIADLSTIWAIADIYEYEAPEIQVGQEAAMTLSYYPGRAFRGKVTYIYPQVDNMTRTLKVRLEFPNPGFALKPDMYANIEFKIDYGKRVVVPQEAILDSGSEQLVFISHEGGYFEPRKVQLGAKVDDQVIVLAGLKPGERVVTSANFLIDSESKLKSAAGGMGMPGMNHGGGAPSGSKKAPQVDRSGRQPGPTQERNLYVAPKPEQEDHSGHKPNGEASKLKPEDHSQHQAKPEDALRRKPEKQKKEKPKPDGV